MPTRLWNCVVLMTVMVAGTSGTLMPSFAQVKEQMRTFDLDQHHRFGAGTEPCDPGCPKRNRTE